MVFAPGNYTESALIIKQARGLGITVPFLGGDTWETPEFVDVGKQAVEGAVFSLLRRGPITETSKTFLDAYRKQYNKEPAAVTALGFDGYLVVRAAIEKAGSLEGAKIRDALATTDSFPGAAGHITFDQNRDAEERGHQGREGREVRPDHGSAVGRSHRAAAGGRQGRGRCRPRPHPGHEVS